MFFKVIFFLSQILSAKSTCSRVTKATTSAAIPAVVVKMCSFWRFLFHYILLIILKEFKKRTICFVLQQHVPSDKTIVILNLMHILWKIYIHPYFFSLTSGEMYSSDLRRHLEFEHYKVDVNHRWRFHEKKNIFLDFRPDGRRIWWTTPQPIIISSIQNYQLFLE